MKDILDLQQRLVAELRRAVYEHARWLGANPGPRDDAQTLAAKLKDWALEHGTALCNRHVHLTGNRRGSPLVPVLKILPKVHLPRVKIHVEVTAHVERMVRFPCSGSSEGAEHGRSYLTEEDVLDIRASPEEGASSLAKRFGVSPSTIRRILTEKIWVQEIPATTREEVLRVVTAMRAEGDSRPTKELMRDAEVGRRFLPPRVPGPSKLTWEKVRAIRAVGLSRRTARIAREYGVSTATILGVLNGTAWADPLYVPVDRAAKKAEDAAHAAARKEAREASLKEKAERKQAASAACALRKSESARAKAEYEEARKAARERKLWAHTTGN